VFAQFLLVLSQVRALALLSQMANLALLVLAPLFALLWLLLLCLWWQVSTFSEENQLNCYFNH
jgi:hypothetical protein